MQLIKKCEYCQHTFIAKTTVTRYCSHKCNQQHYKKVKRDEKTRQTTTLLISKQEQVLLRQDFLSISDAARLAGVSERTIFRMISRRILKPVKKGRNVTIKVNDLLKCRAYENLY